MNEELNYKRIMVGLVLNNKDYDNATGHRIYTDDFMSRLRKQEDEFKRIFEDILVKQFGETGWAINFIELPVDEKRYFADLYLNEPYNIEMDMIATMQFWAKQYGYIFTYYRRGTIANYIEYL